MVWNFLKLKTENSFKSLQDNLRAIVGFIEKHWVPILIIFSITTILYFLGHIINFLADLWYPYDIELKEIKNQELYTSIIKAKNENVLKIFAAITALGLAIWRLIIADKNRKIADENKKIADENHKISKKQEINERYAKAIELLGHKSEAVRIGALYTLEQLSKENEEYFKICLESIAGYIRHESNCSQRIIESSKKWQEYAINLDSYKIECRLSEENIYNLEKPEKPQPRYLPEDIKTAVNILSRSGAPEEKHNLKNIDWCGIDFITSSIKFENIDFSHSIFINVKFPYEVNLSTCYLQRAKLYEVHLYKANLQGIDLQWAKLEGANLEDAHLYKANLQGIDLQDANLRGADLQYSNLYKADLKGADLERADLREVISLEEADLQWADLQGAKLDKETFSKFKNELKGWTFNEEGRNKGYLTKAPEEPESNDE